MVEFIVEFTFSGDNQTQFWTIHADGIKKLGGIGVNLIFPDKDVLKYGVQLQFVTTNNESKYEAILTSVRLAKTLRVKSLVLKNDSKLIVVQVNHEYEGKEERLQKYQKLAIHMANHFDKIMFVQVLREENSEVDEVAWIAMSK